MNKIHEAAEIAYLGVTVEELARVFNAIPSKYFGLTLDIAHASLLPGGPESFIDAFPNRIISTHVSDNDMVLDYHLPVGNGKIDFKRVFEKLVKIGFKGTLNIELPRSNEDQRSEQAATGADPRGAGNPHGGADALDKTDPYPEKMTAQTGL